MAAVQFQQNTEGSFQNSPRTLTWQRLEAMRIKRLGLSNKYSRHFNITRSTNETTQRLELAGSSVSSPPEAQALASSAQRKQVMPSEPGVNKTSNSIAPFATFGKPTCGYFFSDHTNHKKMKFGIPPSDLVKWRTFTPNNAN